MIMGITISNSQVYFLSEKHSLHFVGDDGIYSVGEDLVKQNTTFFQTETFMDPRELALLARQLRK